MFKKFYILFICIPLTLILLTACKPVESNQETYLSFISVPIDAKVPDVLTLDCILSVTNPDPNNPEATLPAVQFGVFGYTTKTGEIEYYVYGKKEIPADDQLKIIEEGFYPINFYRDKETISITLKNPVDKLKKTNPGTGVVTAYEDTLPFDFYAPTETPGLFSFVDANGRNNFRVYATFNSLTNEDSIGNFYPANDDGSMIEGSLPVVTDYEVTLKNAGCNAAARLLTTPIGCTNVQVVYMV